MAEELEFTYLDVLAEEDKALAGDTTPELAALRESLLQARLGKSLEADPAKCRDWQRLVDTAEEQLGMALFRHLRKKNRTALCFSGGGIRSSTFGLGVLQGLIAYSAPGSSRRNLIGELDYLSTVSGGGYLGGWFSAWAARASALGCDLPKDAKEPGPNDGPEAVFAALSRDQHTGFEPEADEVQHLRRYSNYLAPKTGVLSADTWTLVATTFRNMFLNWLVLLPLFAAVLLIPILAWMLTDVPDGWVESQTLWILLLTGLGAGAVSVAYIGYDLPNGGDARRSLTSFLWLCLFPLAIAAIQLNVFWDWLPEAADPDAAWFDFVHRGKAGLTWLHFAFTGAAMHGGGMFLGMAASRLLRRQPPTVRGLWAVLFAAFTGAIAGWAAWMIAPLYIEHHKAYTVLAFPAVLGVFMLGATLLVGATSYITEDEDREWWARSGGWLIAIALSWIFFSACVLYAAKVLLGISAEASAAFTAATGLTGWAAAKMGKSPDTPSGRSPGADPSKLLKSGFIKHHGAKLILPVFLILVTMLLGAADLSLIELLRTRSWHLLPFFWPNLLAPMGAVTANSLWLLGFLALICAFASKGINVNKFSLHGMYRMRLIRAYLGASNRDRRPNPFTDFDESDNVPMFLLSQRRPLHVVNMTLNLVHGKELAWQQRKAEPFTSTRLHTGGVRVGYRRSRDYAGFHHLAIANRPITLGTVMTISGAAASPNMGYHSSPLLTLVMTLFNARLGWWLGNPRAKRSVWQKPGPNSGVRTFVSEALGMTDDCSDWVYLSDGGHFENLGVYEMVLRRCGLIIVSDSGADPGYTYEDLGNAVRKVRVDLGISINFLSPGLPAEFVEEKTKPISSHHCAIAEIRYDDVDTGAEPGLLIYIKPSLNGNEPADVHHYAAVHKPFPQQPTSDQFYDESQFESYRRLGLHIIEEICDKAPRGSLMMKDFVKAAKIHAGLPVSDDQDRSSGAAAGE